MQNIEQVRAKRLTAIRAKIAEADHDPHPSLSETDVDRHFEDRLKQSLAASPRDGGF